MTKNTRLDNFEKLVEKTPSSFINRFKQFKKDKKWQDKSSMISIQVLENLKQKGWTQKKLSKELGVSAQQVNKIIKGNENLTLETICKLESVLDITIIDIVDHISINKIEVSSVKIKAKSTPSTSLSSIFSASPSIYEDNTKLNYTKTKGVKMQIVYNKTDYTKTSKNLSAKLKEAI